MHLTGKKAIVTGANRSIGKAIALAFAKEGADVVVSYRSDEKGAKEAILAIEAIGRRGEAVHADFLDPNGASYFFEKALNFLGHIDILVNNAAGYDASSLLDLKMTTFEELLKVGVTAPMQLIQLAAQEMIKKNSAGSIINISATSGNRPYPNRAAHSTAKAALNMLTKSAALELAKYQIRVNALAPGPTPYDGVLANSSSQIPLGREGDPSDQAEAAIYLASEKSSWITGQIITIDGGQTLSFS